MEIESRELTFNKNTPRTKSGVKKKPTKTHFAYIGSDIIKYLSAKYT